jgi:hypothetical protein
MEGDAGAGRLNPPPMPRFRRLRRPSKKSSPQFHQEPTAAVEESAQPEDAVDVVDEADQTSPAVPADEAVPAEEPSEPDEAPDETTAAAAEEADEPVEEADEPVAAGAPAAEPERGPSRLGRGWLAGIAAALVLFAGALGGLGYLSLRYHHQSQVIAREDAAALKAAVECVSATQAPDTNAMTASEQKIIDCGTGAFRSQALLYTSMIVQAYQASNVHVQVSDVRAAVARHNNDGSVEILVAMRVKVASDQSQKETGYRLKVTMAFAEGQYKISKLDQVTK